MGTISGYQEWFQQTAALASSQASVLAVNLESTQGNCHYAFPN